MHPAVKGQCSPRERVVCRRRNDDDPPSLVRSEFLADSDVNTLLRRYGVGVPLRPVSFGEADTDLDLTVAHGDVVAARAAYAQLPREFRERYPSFEALYAALLRGDVVSLVPAESDEDSPHPVQAVSDPKGPVVPPA